MGVVSREWVWLAICNLNIYTSASKKNSLNKKGYIGFVGSQPMLLLLHQIFRQASKSSNIGCDPTNPMYPFLFREFFY